MKPGFAVFLYAILTFMSVCWIRIRSDFSIPPLKISSLLLTEYGRFIPGWWHDPGFLHWCLPEQQEAGSLEKGEDREAAGDGAEWPVAPPGVGPYLTFSGCVSCSQALVLLPPHRGRQQLFPRRPAEEETPTPSIPASPSSKSSSNRCPSAFCLLPRIAIPADSSQNRPTLPQCLLWLPEPLSISVPPCFASEVLTAYGPAAWLHYAVNKSSCHSEDAVCVSWTFHCRSSSENTFSTSSAFLEYDQSQHKKADLYWLIWSGSDEADLQKSLWIRAHLSLPSTLPTKKDMTRSALSLSKLSPVCGRARCRPVVKQSVGHWAGTCHLSALSVSWQCPLVFCLSPPFKQAFTQQ